MLTHGAPEVAALAARCAVTPLDDKSGWAVDLWLMDDNDVSLAVDAYEALLLGGRSDPVEDLLKAKGYDLSALLLDSEHSKDDITRADLAELTAAASIAASQEHDIDELHMPNVPKMARRRATAESTSLRFG